MAAFDALQRHASCIRRLDVRVMSQLIDRHLVPRIPLLSGHKDSGEENADDLNIVVGVNQITPVQEVVVTEDQRDECDVEDDREDEVEDRSPE